jgi:uncharacterized protein YdeI (YjbR/CyaY-like superfamily)
MKEEKQPISPIYFSSQKKFRHWLEKNHDKVEFAWLAIKKKNSQNPCITYFEAVEESLCFGWIDGQVKSLNEENFIQRFTPRRERSLWSKINKDKALKLIKEGKMTEAGLKKIEDAKRDGRWQKAYSTAKKLAIPDDLKKSLLTVSGAKEAFNNFAPGHQSMYIHWLNFAKKEETRRKRIEKVILWSLQKKKPGFL